MEKDQVTISGLYAGKVGTTVVPVRITGESPHSGWDAVNTKTGRKVRIRSAARLRRRLDRAAIAVGRRVVEWTQHGGPSMKKKTPLFPAG